MNIRKIILPIFFMLLLPTAIATDFGDSINYDAKIVNALTFQYLSNSIKQINKSTDFLDGYQKATSRYAQTNVIAAYKDFSKIINSQENKNDYIYVILSQRLANIGFFTLSQSAAINIEDNDLWHSTINFIKAIYQPAVTLTYDEEIYLAQLQTATLYNNSAKETIKILENNDKILKKSDYANYVLAVAYNENKNYFKATNAINRAIFKAPDCINYQIFKAKIYANVGNYKGALNIIKDIEKSSLNKKYIDNLILADKYYILMKTSSKDKAKYYSALLLLQNGEGKKAIAEAQSAITLNKKNMASYILIGDYYIRNKNYEKAKEYYEKALTVNKKYAPAIMGIGHYNYANKNYQKSLEYYQNAYKYSTQNEQLLLCLVNNYLVLNNTEKATFYLNKLLKINHNSDNAYYLMSKIVPEMKEHYLRMAIQLDTTNEHAWYDLIELKIEQQNYKKAEEYLYPLLKLYPNDKKYIYLNEQLKNKNSANISTNINDDNTINLFIR